MNEVFETRTPQLEPSALARASRILLACGLLSAVVSAQSMHLNEVYATHAGPDTLEFVEIQGTPGSDLTNHMLLVVEGDGNQAGRLDLALDLTGSLIPPDGYFVIGDSGVQGVDLITGLQDLLENGTQTIYLGVAQDPLQIIALLGMGLDPDGDGTTSLATMGFDSLDRVALVDAEFPATDRVYDNAPALGPTIDAKLPPGVYCGDDAVAGWCGGSFLDGHPNINLDQPRTPGAPNGGCVPVQLTHAGFVHRSLGLAGLSAMADGSLRVSALTGGGNDGVELELVPLSPSGMGVQRSGLQFGIDLAPVSASSAAAVRLLGTLVPFQGGGPSHFEFDFTPTGPDEVELRYEFTDTSPGCVLIEVYRGPIKVKSNEFSPPPPIGSVILEKLPSGIEYAFVDQEGDQFESWLRFDQTTDIVLPLVGPTPIAADAVRILSEGLPMDTGSLSKLQLLASGGPSLRLSSEGRLAFDHPHLAQGSVQYVSVPNGIGASGFDGIDIGSVLRLVPRAPGSVLDGVESGLHVDLDMSAGISPTIFTMPEFGGHDCGQIEFRYHTEPFLPQSIDLNVEFPNLGTSLVSVEMFDGGTSVGSSTLPAGDLGSLTPLSGSLPVWNSLETGVGPEPVWLACQFAADLSFAPTGGGQALVGDQVRLAPVGATMVMSRLLFLEFQMLNVDTLTLSGERVLDFCETEPYCVAAPNSTGSGAHITSNAQCSLAQNELLLTVSPVPSNVPGLFLISSGQLQLPFGDGFLCLASPLCRLPVIHAQFSTMSYALDFQQLPPQCNISAGQQWNFQAWYRDPASTGAAYNLSDAIRLSFRP